MAASQLFGSYVYFSGGMNSGFDPAAIEDNQYFKGLNVTCRGGVLRTRPSFQPRPLTFTPSYEEGTFKYGKFQGAFAYDKRIVVVVSGAAFVINTRSWTVDAISARTQLFLNQYVDRVHFCRAERYLVVQDGVNRPLLFDGSELRRSDKDKDEVPAGTVMVFGQGRLFVKTAPSLFLAGDIYMPNKPESAITFTETDYLNGGGAFALPSHMGSIQAMSFATGYDTSTGDGPLLVGGDGGVLSFAVYKPRSEWFNTDLAKQQVAGVGPCGPHAGVQLNADWLFWSRGGLRSFAALKEQSTVYRRFLNLSAEVENIVKRETPWMLPLVGLVEFDDRLLTTTVGRRCLALDRYGKDTEDVYFEAVSVLDFNQMDGWTAKGVQRRASYDGVWTGLRFTAFAKMNDPEGDRCFVFGKDDFGNNKLWELTKTITGQDGDIDIMSRVLTKAFVGKAPPDYVDAPFERKRFHKVQLWIDKHAGATPIKASVCVDGNPFFRYIGTAELNAPIELVGVPATEDYDVGVSQSRPHLVFSAPAEAGPENASGTAALTGYAFMLGFEWRGHVEVSRMLTSLLTVTETRAPICSTVPVTQSMATPTDDLMLNDFVYSSYSGVNYAGCSIPVTRS